MGHRLIEKIENPRLIFVDDKIERIGFPFGDDAVVLVTGDIADDRGVRLALIKGGKHRFIARINKIIHREVVFVSFAVQ